VTDAPSSRERLLGASIDYVREHGVAELSLRRLAGAIGTSHRMLIYHFGSKQGLLVAIVRAVEEQQRRTMAALDADPSLSPADIARRMWQQLADPSLWPNERLFFETYAQALQARAHTVDFLDDVVESWLGPIAEMRRAQGVPAEVAAAQARLDLAVTRGLLLDLLATGDRAGTDAAVEHSITLFESWRATLPDPPLVTARASAPVPDADDDEGVRLLLVSGSLRAASTNSAVMRTAQLVAPAGIAITVYDAVADLPPFNPDDDTDALHPAVADLRARIHRADGVLFSTPEYAGALPGAFKNALDWMIGDDQARSIAGKPVAWINASVRDATDAHESLRKVLGYASAEIVEEACAHIPVATALVDADGVIEDDAVRARISASLAALAAVSGGVADGA
jgi:NAD(P)H-dependent FMN reductase